MTFQLDEYLFLVLLFFVLLTSSIIPTLRNMDIQDLPLDVRNHLRSSSSINTVSHCVMELVFNSLDAKSTAVGVRVNLETFRIQVVDNGHGMCKRNITLAGVRHMTSKCRSLKDLTQRHKWFGFRGEALASIVDISKTISITSRGHDSENTYMRKFENGKWSEVTAVNKRPNEGTTVSIEDFLFNLQVRQKSVKVKPELQSIKKLLEELALIHPKVTFSLRDDTSKTTLLQTQKLGAISNSLCMLDNTIKEEDLKEVKAVKGKLKIRGLLSKRTSSNRKLQFIYVNKRPVYASKILKLINDLFEKLLRPSVEEGHPVFIINIRCPKTEVNIRYTAFKAEAEFVSWDTVLTTVETIVTKVFQINSLVADAVEKNVITTNSKPAVIMQSPGASILEGYAEGNLVKRMKSNEDVNSVCSVVTPLLKTVEDENVSAKNVSNFVHDERKHSKNKVESKFDKPGTSKNANTVAGKAKNLKKSDNTIKFVKNEEVTRNSKKRKAVTNSSNAPLTKILRRNRGNAKNQLKCSKPRGAKANDKHKEGLKITKNGKILSSDTDIFDNKEEADHPMTIGIQNKQNVMVPDSLHMYELDEPEMKSPTKQMHKNNFNGVSPKLTSRLEPNLTRPQSEGKELIMDVFLKSIAVRDCCSQTTSKSIMSKITIPNKTVAPTMVSVGIQAQHNVTLSTFVRQKCLNSHRNHKPNMISREVQTSTVHKFSIDFAAKTNRSKDANIFPGAGGFDCNFRLPQRISPSELIETTTFVHSSNFTQTCLDQFGRITTINRRQQKKCTVKPNADKYFHNFQPPFMNRPIPLYDCNVPVYSNLGITHSVKHTTYGNVQKKPKIVSKDWFVDKWLEYQNRHVNSENDLVHTHGFKNTIHPYYHQPACFANANPYFDTNYEFIGSAPHCQQWIGSRSNNKNVLTKFDGNVETRDFIPKYEFGEQRMRNRKQTILATKTKPRKQELFPKKIFEFSNLDINPKASTIISYNSHTKNKKHLLTNNLLPEPRNNSGYFRSMFLRSSSEKHGTSKYFERFSSKNFSNTNRKDAKRLKAVSSNNIDANECVLPRSQSMGDLDHINHRENFKLLKSTNKNTDHVSTTPWWNFDAKLSSTKQNKLDKNTENIGKQSVFDKEGICNDALKTKQDIFITKDASVQLSPFSKFTPKLTSTIIDFQQTEGEEICVTPINSKDKRVALNDKNVSGLNQLETFFTFDKPLETPRAVKPNLIQDDLQAECQANKCLDSNSKASETVNLTLQEGLVPVFPFTKSNSFLPAQRNWVEGTNHLGAKCHINKRTGMTFANTPKSDGGVEFVKRMEFVPKGMSPILVPFKEVTGCLSPGAKKSLCNTMLETYRSELCNVKWTNYNSEGDFKQYLHDLHKNMAREFESIVPKATAHKKLHCKSNTVPPRSSLKAEIFDSIRLIGQLDKKFILALVESDKLLVIFDQHAVHERIRLEKLCEDYTEVGPCGTLHLKSTHCNQSIIIRLASEQIQIIENLQDVCENLGLKIQCFGDRIQILRLPSCLYKKAATQDVNKSIISLLNEVIEASQTTNGVSSTMPTLIQDTIKMEACRGAIKFGDLLTKAQMSNFLDQLSKCKLPFQCAHGRPTVMPLLHVSKNVNTQVLKNELCLVGCDLTRKDIMNRRLTHVKTTKQQGNFRKLSGKL